MASDTSRPATPSSVEADASLQSWGYSQYRYGAPAADEINLRELWSVIWNGKWTIIVITAIFTGMVTHYAFSLPNIYQSQALLAPSEDSQGGGMARMASQLGGLATLAGLNMGSGGGNKVEVAMAVMTSRQFIAQFIEKHVPLPELMAVERWDRSSNQIVFNPKLYESNTGNWVRDASPPKSSTPSTWEAYKAFTSGLTVSRGRSTGFVTVTVKHQSPHLAARWARLLVEEVNAILRKKDVAEAERSIEFLQDRLAGVPLANMRTVFYQLIEEQTKTVMLAEVRDEYVFSVIDPPLVPEEKVEPKRSLICLFGLLLGGALAIFIVFTLHFARNSKGQEPEDRRHKKEAPIVP